MENLRQKITEIAEDLNMKEGSVKVGAHRLKSRYKEKLKRSSQKP